MTSVNRCIVLFFLGIGLSAAYEITNVGWWKNTRFYQIYPRSFMDSNGDGVGDLNGITSKLDYFNDIGIGAIWLSPIFTSPMKDFGYDISDFRSIHHEFGTMDDFEALTKKANELGLKVILDLVPNHVSSEHEWFKNSENGIEPYKDYFIWRDGNATGGPPNNWISVFSGSGWTYSTKRKQWYFHQFLAEQPDLNYRNPEVRREMMNIIQFWLNKGVGGFRIDAVPHLFENITFADEPRSNALVNSTDYKYLDHVYTKDQPETYELVQSWRNILDSWSANVGSDELVMMTEAYTSLEKTTDFYKFGAHVPFNFMFIVDVNSTSTPNDFKKIIDLWMTEANKYNGTPNWVMGNHDRSRTESRYPNRGDHMTMLAMILPGVSVTYYGEEIGMEDNCDISFEETKDPQGKLAGEDNYLKVSRDPCRTPFQWDDSTHSGFSKNETIEPWLPVNKNYKTLNLAAEKAATTSHYHIYKQLTSLKNSSSALISGRLNAVVTNNNKALTIVRTYSVGNTSKETVLLVISFEPKNNLSINLSSQIPSNIALNGSIEVASLNSPLQRGEYVDLSKLNLAPNAALVIIADQKRVHIEGNTGNSNNAGERNAISFAKATVVLIALLLINFR